MTVFFVSHDMAAIQRLCDRVILLNGGQLVMDGTPEAVVSHYEQAAWAGVGRDEGAQGHHVSELGEILSTRLLSDDGREVGAARVDEELHVSVLFSALVPGMRARCVLALMNRGVVAFRTAQPDDIEVTEPGVFGASVRIPGHNCWPTRSTP